MVLDFTAAKIVRDEDGFWLSLKITAIPKAREFVYNLKNKLYTATLKEHREKRSLDANAYAWVLMSKIADAVGTSKDEVYLEMLERYGVFTHIIAKPQAAARIKEEWRAVKELGTVTVNGQTGIQLQCYYGSSTYDTKEMSTLINGIVSECKDLDIETATPREIAMMCEEWNK